MNRKKFFYLILVAVIAFVSAGAGALVGGKALLTVTGEGQAPGVETISNAPSQLTLSNTQVETAITQTVEKVSPAVVTVIGTVPGKMTFFGRAPDGQVSGSGVIISAEGYVVTNNHVVEDASELIVALSNGVQLSAEVVSTDIYADLAVLKAEGEMPAVATFGNSDNLKPGETVIAIGSPLGEFRNTVTVGVVSATGRSLDTGKGYFMEDLVQTDAAINQGNSGGPLVNLNGEIIGINTIIVRGGYGSNAVAEGLGFSIPSNTVRLIAEQIIEKGHFARPYLGVSWQAVSPSIAKRYDLDTDWGAYITEVARNSPAHEAGLEQGDIILSLGDQDIDEENSFINTLFAHQPGELVELRILRDREEITLKVTLGEATVR